MTLPECFRALGLEQGAGFRDVHRAWRTLAKQYHPDAAYTNPSDISDHNAYMRTLNEAYETLRAHFRERPAPVRLHACPEREELARNAAFAADSESRVGSIPADILSSRGWYAEGSAPWSLEIRFARPAVLDSFRLEAIPLPYIITRDLSPDSERHFLRLAFPDGTFSEQAVIRQGRDIAFVFDRETPPVQTLTLVTAESLYPPAWRNPRIYGYCL
jgi:curved DNA-binding protein CbpA